MDYKEIETSIKEKFKELILGIKRLTKGDLIVKMMEIDGHSVRCSFAYVKERTDSRGWDPTTGLSIVYPLKHVTSNDELFTRIAIAVLIGFNLVSASTEDRPRVDRFLEAAKQTELFEGE